MLLPEIEASAAWRSAQMPRGGGAPQVGFGYGSTTLSETVSENITPPRGKTSQGLTYFSTTLQGYVQSGDVVAQFDGTSQAAWEGFDPVNCSEISLTDKWWVNGWFVSFTYPAGLGITGSGEEGSWTTSFANNWLVVHHYNNIDFSTAWDIFSADETSSFVMTFGTTSWNDTTPTA